MFASSMPLRRPPRIAVSNFFFISGLCFATWASRIPDIQHHLKLDDAGLGSILFASPAGSIVSLPFIGLLVTKIGSRLSLLVGCFIYAALLCGIGMVNTTWELAGILFFFGVAGNIVNIAVNTQAVGVEALYKRSIMASFHGLWSLAGFTGAAIGTLMLSQNISPLMHFICISVLILLIVALFYPYSLKPGGENQQEPKSAFVWPDKSLINLGMLAFCCLACEGCMFDWSGIYFRDVVHAPKELITIGYTVFMATMASGRFIADWLVTKFGVKRVLQLSGCLITTGLLVAVIFPGFYTASFGFFLTGFGVSSVVPLTYGLAGKAKTMSAGMALAAVSTVGFLGFLIGPPLIGYIAKATNLRWSFTLMAILGFGTALLASKAKVSE